MNEKEIIENLKELISWRGKHVEVRDYEIEAIQSLLELYNKEKNENHNLKEQLENYIPRRRIRRIYKMLGDILEADTEVKPYVETLKKFINKIEKEGKAEAGQEIKTSIEHLLSVRER